MAGDKRLSAEKWAEIELLYRSGAMSIRALAAQFGIRHGAIQYRATREGWVKDRQFTTPIVRELASRLVEGDLVVTEESIISAAAIQARITSDHRQTTSRLRAYIGDLWDELEIYLALLRDLRQNPPALAEDGKPDRTDERIRKAAHMIQVFGDPVLAAARLAQATHRLVTTDRLVHGIDNAPGGQRDPDDAAVALAKLREWDKSVEEELAKRPYLLAKPVAPLANGSILANGHANGKGNGNGHAH